MIQSTGRSANPSLESTRALPNRPGWASPRGHQNKPATLLSIGVDGLKLIDLQLQLLQIDAAEFWKRGRKGLVLMGLAFAALLSALPVLLMGLAELIREAIGLSVEGAFLLVSGATIISAAIVAWLAFRALDRSAAPLKRSGDELRANIAWLREVLHAEDQPR